MEKKEIQFNGPEESYESIMDLKIRIVALRTAPFGFPYEYVETWPESIINWAFGLIMEG